MRLRNWIIAVALAAGLVAPALAVAPSSGAATRAAASAGKAQITVVHGIPGVAVDVYVDGKKTLKDFTFGSVVTVALPAGRYSLAVRPHGASAKSKPILSATTKVTSGENATIVANLTTKGRPALSVFANPTSRVASGKDRLIVRHVADAPGVDVYANGTKVISDLTNPHSSAALVVPSGTYRVKVDLTGTKTTVIGPATFHLAGGKTTIVYAIGNPKSKSLTVATQSY